MLFDISRTVTYDLCANGQLSQPIRWLGDKRVMFCLDDVANQLAHINNLMPATEDVLRQYRESVLFVRNLEKSAKRKKLSK